MSNFPCSLIRNITSHRMKNLAFHSLLRWKLPILTALYIFLEKVGRRSVLNLRVKELSSLILFAPVSGHLPLVRCDPARQLLAAELAFLVAADGQVHDMVPVRARVVATGLTVERHVQLHVSVHQQV